MNSGMEFLGVNLIRARSMALNWEKALYLELTPLLQMIAF
jgi:hypothetical protein